MSRLDERPRRAREALITQEYDGIYPVFEALYIQSIIYAAERAEKAFQNFDTAVARESSPSLIFAAVQEALTHAGALSRFFWPVKKDRPLTVARGKRLREAFELNDESPLKWRRLRNAFEHFDEDLDRFLIEDRSGYFFPGPIVDDCSLADEALGDVFKLVDPDNGICVLLGEKFEFHPIRQEVQRILTAAIEKDHAGSRL